MALLFPAEPRALPGRRPLKITLRAIHVLCVALLLGSHAFAAAPDTRAACLTYAILSGSALLAVDLHETAGFLLQVRGLVVVLKIATVLALPAFGAATPWVLGAVILVSVVVSHAPSRLRYHLLVPTRIPTAHSKG